MNKMKTELIKIEIPLNQKFNLKDRLDEIDNIVRKAAWNGYFWSRLNILMGMWEKGRAVAEYRGVNSAISFLQLEKQTGRQRESLKKWHDLYLKYPQREIYIEIAKEQAKNWTERAFPENLLLPHETSLLPLGKYQVIYADPPWQYQNVGLAGSAEKHYETLSVEEIINYEDSSGRRVPDLMIDTTILFLWVPNSFLREGLEVIEGWGFEYKANFVWIKHKMAYGKLAFYNYGQHEFLFVAVKGSCLPIKGSLVPSILQAKKGKHSKKPEKMYEIIESMYPPPYIELFARDKREGWDSWGAEIG